MTKHRPPQAGPGRRAAWRSAEQEFLRRAGSAKFLFGTLFDRQTGATTTHHWREKMGVRVPAPRDGAARWTRGVDGETRLDSWTRAELLGPRMFVPLAGRVLNRSYTPQPLLLCRFDEDGKGKMRTIAVPTTLDRSLLSVLLEVLEPVIDPVLSEAQHGYRATTVAGQKIEVARLPGVPRGSSRAVALRLVDAVGSGFNYLVETDIKKAFPSVNRTVLKQMLVADGCSKSFAKLILRCLGSWAVDSRKDLNQPKRISGIPLGNPVGPIIFNFYVRQLHGLDLGEVILASYADNFFIAARSRKEGEVALAKFDNELKQKLLLDHSIKQRWPPNSKSPFFVLRGKKDGGWRISVGPHGDVQLKGPESG